MCVPLWAAPLDLEPSYLTGCPIPVSTLLVYHRTSQAQSAQPRPWMSTWLLASGVTDKRARSITLTTRARLD